MFFPHLPGRDPDPEQMEAHRALGVLKEAEEIKDSGGNFLGLVREEVGRQKGILNRVSELLEGMSDEEAEEMAPRDEGGSLRTDSRGVDDFLARLRASVRKEDQRTEETSSARRSRIARGKGKRKVVGNQVLVEFT